MGDAYNILQQESSGRDVCQDGMYVLQNLAQFHLPLAIEVQFYTATKVSVLTSSIWFGAASSREMRNLEHTIKPAEKIIWMHSVTT